MPTTRNPSRVHPTSMSRPSIAAVHTPLHRFSRCDRSGQAAAPIRRRLVRLALLTESAGIPSEPAQRTQPRGPRRSETIPQSQVFRGLSRRYRCGSGTATAALYIQCPDIKRKPRSHCCIRCVIPCQASRVAHTRRAGYIGQRCRSYRSACASRPTGRKRVKWSGTVIPAP